MTETTALSPVSVAEDFDDTVHACEEDEDGLESLNHRAEGAILPQTDDVGSTTRASTVRVELSFEDKEEDDAITKLLLKLVAALLVLRNHNALASCPGTQSL